MLSMMAVANAMQFWYYFFNHYLPFPIWPNTTHKNSWSDGRIFLCFQHLIQPLLHVLILYKVYFPKNSILLRGIQLQFCCYFFFFLEFFCLLVNDFILVVLIVLVIASEFSADKVCPIVELVWGYLFFLCASILLSYGENYRNGSPEDKD